MKNFIKCTIGVVFFLALIGTVGAYELNNISTLRCLIQSGICFAVIFAMIMIERSKEQ